MSNEIAIALIGVSGVLCGAGLTYLGLRNQIQENRRKDASQSQHDSVAAELSYMAKLQEMLSAAGDKLVAAEAEHHEREVVLERAKYIAEETLKQANLDHERTLREERRLNSEQNDEIVILTARLKAKEVEVDDLRKRTEGVAL